MLALGAGTCIAATSNTVTTEHLTAQLIAEHTALVPGRTSAIALKLVHQPQWHSYWRTPGDSGLPTQIRWQAPAGVKLSDIRWPAPQRLPFGPLTNFGYKGEVWLISDIELAADYDKPTVNLTGRAEWLVCNDVCIPEQGELQLTLPVAPAGEVATANSAASASFEQTRARLPLAASGWTFSATPTGAGSSLRIIPPSGEPQIERGSFFPYDEGLIEPSAPQLLVSEGQGYRLEITRAVQPVAPLERLRGIVVLETIGRPPVVLEVDTPTAEPPNGSPEVTANAISLLTALLLAFAGGMVLNLMPCVFPVLSIKVLALARDPDRVATRRNGLLYGVGVIASFWLLAALLLGLRAAGHQLGWGFQLQSPLIVSGLAVLFFVLALNLVGLFEFGNFLPGSVTSANPRHPDINALFTGGLAVAVASPCTGPFMAAALGYAITQPGWSSFAVFTSLGMGMALPYVLLAWIPSARRLLPRPGAWMQQLRQFLAFPLFATVIWLAWVLGMQVNASAIIYLLLALWLITLGLWIRRTSPGSMARQVVAWGVVVSALIPFYGIATALQVQPDSAASQTSSATAWGEYSEARVKALVAEGRTVFVDFTAAWCITCQVNKQLVLDTAEIDKAFADSGVVKLRADWTNRDPDITHALNRLGRSGVPVYLIQRPGQAPELLPELLSKELLKSALGRKDAPSISSNPSRTGR
ncbi:protein-disulfide reductase DsbD family protein [Pseudomonas shirazica]|uniref:protein-disulfide reductase DsbD family protein n=1 Tax=Pseudomonas shirazica TaxID=1940636 RepID=UPI003AAE87C8